MKAGELFEVEWCDWEIQDHTLMRAIVDFSFDAELARWRAERPHGQLPPCTRDDVCARLVERGLAEIVEDLAVITIHAPGEAWPSLTPESDARGA